MGSPPADTRDSEPVDLGYAVLEAVAEAEGTPPLDLRPPLYEVIDPDALNALFAGRAGATRRVQFRYQGYDITVEGDGQVRLENGDET